MEKKKIVIFGDSYSTFDGYIPKGYATYYPRSENGINDVKQTWWSLLSEEMGYEVVLNNSWSGSTVCNTGYEGDCSKTNSFIYRLKLLIDEGFFEKNSIDKVFVYGGINDSATGNICGEPKFCNWSEEDLKIILPGYAYFIHKLLSVIGKENIHVVISTDHIRQELQKGFAEICEHYGIEYTKVLGIEQIDGHPTPNGMVAIKNQVLKGLVE